jgi:hypothetical protein
VIEEEILKREKELLVQKIIELEKLNTLISIEKENQIRLVHRKEEELALARNMLIKCKY